MSIIRRAAAPPVTFAAPATYAPQAAVTYAAPTAFAAPMTYGAPVTYGAPMIGAPIAAPRAYAAAPIAAQPRSRRQRCPRSQVPKFEATNQLVPDAADGGCDNHKEVHALVVYVDYGFQPAKSQGWCPAGFGEKLDTYENAMMFKQLLQDAGVRDIVEMSNTQATKEAVRQKLQEVGRRCDGDDIFIFYYSGHGNGMKDQDGDEDDGQDEAMCLPNARGECNESTWLRDDDFAADVCGVRAGHKLIILDCCHSGTMLDFQKHMWEGQKAISVVGCKDAQESAGMGGGTRGGAFTKSLDAAVRRIGNQKVTVGAVFNELMGHSQRFIPQGHKQDITINCAPGYAGPGKMKWPLIVAGGAPAQQFAQVVQPMAFGRPVGVQVAQPMSYPMAQAAMPMMQSVVRSAAQPVFTSAQPRVQMPFGQAAPQGFVQAVPAGFAAPMGFRGGSVRIR